VSSVADAGSVTTARSPLPKLGLRFAIGYLTFAAILFSIYGFPFELFGARHDWQQRCEGRAPRSRRFGNR
jgi:hypothetical protein